MDSFMHTIDSTTKAHPDFDGIVAKRDEEARQRAAFIQRQKQLQQQKNNPKPPQVNILYTAICIFVFMLCFYKILHSNITTPIIIIITVHRLPIMDHQEIIIIIIIIIIIHRHHIITNHLLINIKQVLVMLMVNIEVLRIIIEGHRIIEDLQIIIMVPLMDIIVTTTITITTIIRVHRKEIIIIIIIITIIIITITIIIIICQNGEQFMCLDFLENGGIWRLNIYLIVLERQKMWMY